MAKDFHTEMGNYLDRRMGDKKKIKDVFKREKKAEFKEIDEVEDEIEQMEKEQGPEEEFKESKRGFFSRLFGFGKDDDFDDAEMEESRPELDEDVKRVLRISFDWINQLPPDKKIKFKHSQDFVEYKAVLEKYGLLKEKKEVEHAQRP